MDADQAQASVCNLNSAMQNMEISHYDQVSSIVLII